MFEAKAQDKVLAGGPVDPAKLMDEVRDYGHDVPTMLGIAADWAKLATDTAVAHGHNHWYVRDCRQMAATFRLVAAEEDFGAVYGERQD